MHYYDDYDYDDDDAIHNNNAVTLETMRLLYEVQHIAVTLSTLPPQNKTCESSVDMWNKTHQMLERREPVTTATL